MNKTTSRGDYVIGFDRLVEASEDCCTVEPLVVPLAYKSGKASNHANAIRALLINFNAAVLITTWPGRSMRCAAVAMFKLQSPVLPV